MKNDRRDSEKLSRRSRVGELTSVWVPDQEQEAMRDLTRARQDMKGLEKITKQRLSAFLLRYGCIYESDKSRWTQAHSRWLFDLADEAMLQAREAEGFEQGSTREKLHLLIMKWLSALQPHRAVAARSSWHLIDLAMACV